ncbi:MAG: hypothetical protein RBS42_08005 [Campylobacterales bacterium]|jgi:broad specificity polyphosphatase/5'/3'-nucleotidase SurE|nr:hypothetical protein [Campylobacterales bacterium]
MKMATATNEIKEELKEHKMADVVNFNINIPANETDKIDLLIKLFEALKISNKKELKVGGNEAYQEELAKENITYEEARDDFFTKYAGSLKIGDDAEQQYNQHRMAKYGK